MAHFFRMWFISIFFSSFPCALIIYCILLCSLFTHEIFIFHMYTNGNLLSFSLEASIHEVPLAWLFLNHLCLDVIGYSANNQQTGKKEFGLFVCFKKMLWIHYLCSKYILYLEQCMWYVSMALLNVESSIFKVNFIVLEILNSATFLLFFSDPLKEISSLLRVKI